ncbi:hypothetical protein BDD12DRAFT_872455 [Trichophaea hybrida]|nr:hypothetical protein BDD12DRAFT_872455 [Trichophaea hybrida]
MATAVGLGASVLPFVGFVGQLPKVAISCYNSIKDAPEYIIHVRERLRDLERILAQIGRVRFMFPISEHGDDDPITRRYWNDKSRDVRSHFDELAELANGWNTNARSAEKSLARLSEDIETLKSVHESMMMSYMSSHQTNYLEAILRQQTPTTENLKQVVQIVNEINATMITE